MLIYLLIYGMGALEKVLTRPAQSHYIGSETEVPRTT